LSEQSRIYEATVRNFIADTLILERILNAFTYEEILNYIKNYKFQTTKDVSGVKQRFLNRVSGFFGNISSENFSSDIEKQIENYLKK
jgi:siderophore synthetase component